MLMLKIFRIFLKGFFCFDYDPMHAQKVLSKGPSTICNSLLILQPYDAYFAMQNEGATDVPIWIEFLGLPIPMW